MTRLTLARHLIDLSQFLDPVESKSIGKSEQQRVTKV